MDNLVKISHCHLVIENVNRQLANFDNVVSTLRLKADKLQFCKKNIYTCKKF